MSICFIIDDIEICSSDFDKEDSDNFDKEDSDKKHSNEENKI